MPLRKSVGILTDLEAHVPVQQVTTTAQISAQPDPDPLAADLAATLRAVEELGRELTAVRQATDPVMSARLADAIDEVAAIHDEVSQQQEEITGLLAGVGAGPAAAMKRFLATLPLATILTTAAGKIVEANGAAHTALQVPSGGLIGKPIFAYVDPADRRSLRSTLGQAGREGQLCHSVARVTPSHGTPVHSYVALMRESTAAPESLGASSAPDVVVRWVIVLDCEAAHSPPSHQQLEALTRLCRLGLDDGDLRSTLTQVADLCRQATPEVSDVSLLVGDPLEPSMTVSTSALAQQLDGVQHLRAAGPIFDAYRSCRPIALDGAAVASHPGLTGDPQISGTCSLLTIPLLSDSRPIGVLTVSSRDTTSVATLLILRHVMPFVEAAQTLIRESRTREEMHRTQEQLASALSSRAVIDQAKGMIMISLNCNADEAFSHLVRISSSRHEKVRDVATSMVNDVLTKRSRAVEHRPE